MHDDSDEEEFVYPGSDSTSPTPEPEEQAIAQPTPPRAGTPTPEPLVHTQPPQSLAPSKAHPSPAQLEALHAAAASGDLRRVQTEFRKAVRADDVEPFELANDASPRTGLTALHAAASRGWLDIVKWLNAASKGHLPIVLYLLTKQQADPLVRNNWGETAYDVAAAVFEVWICEVLQRFESEKWRDSGVPYNPLGVHTTVPLVLYENQRLDVRLKTLAVSGGRPKFSASGLGRRGRQAPFELVLPVASDATGKRIGAWRSDVQLPLREDPFTLPKPGSSREGAERSHFWLSDWTLDVTPPGVDAQEGWQYAHSFSDPDDQWVSEPPPQLERLLSGSGAVGLGLGGSSRSRSSSHGSTSTGSHSPQAWVRRRRWVRVMRRRLDIPPLPFLLPDGAMYHLADGQMIPYVENEESDFGGSEGQELSAMPSSGFSSQDYVARARYLVGTPHPDDGDVSSALEARRMIAKLERATTELRQGLLSDDDNERKIQAEVLLNAYNRELERRRLAAGAQGLLISGDDDLDLDDDDDDDEFHYPGASTPGTARPPSLRSTTTDYFNRSFGSSSRGPTDLTPHLSQAPEFRVPTHEAPQKVLTPRAAPTPHSVHATWERDDAVSECRDCRRRFTFLNRRHCRRCGRIFCDRCSSYRALLDPSDIVHDPSFPDAPPVASQQRVCQNCYEEVTAAVPNGLSASRTNSMERIFIDQRRLNVPSPTRAQSSSQLSDLAECPVCNISLSDLGPPHAQEGHVKNCLEGGTGTVPQSAKYLVYKLPEESSLIGTECVICLEEFVNGSTVARLSCLCSFHNACLSSWLQRGRNCPVHAR
ncbi:hypothetical protein OH76DRAFT_1453700 [Lentinus brumalis]|uniref:RING-type E3 ubiquitin transferase n=1 Tax=Lentinus brumalis TaxID=2498619 RepID=A0A371DN81_9APHY|nr:hypothetical protein OH76DRAFT_1453700 [Polyporus brumalis]